MEIHHSAVILLLILSVFFSCHGQSDKIKDKYKHFLKQHFGPDMTKEKCNSEIKKRGITDSNGNCKEVNSFIKAKSDHIKAVCGEGGARVTGDLYRSLKPFPVITCRLQSGKRPPKCEYFKRKPDTRVIVLGCEEGLPVHYEEGLVVPRVEESPVPSDEESPVDYDEESPVDYDEESPVPSDEESPVPSDEESPVDYGEESPVPSDEESPVPSDEESPVDYGDESPVPSDEESPVPSDEESPVDYEDLVPQGSQDEKSLTEPHSSSHEL